MSKLFSYPMKKLVVLTVLIATLFTLIACTNENENKNDTDVTITFEIDGVSKSIDLVSVVPGMSTWNQYHGFFTPTQAWAKADYRK